MKSSRQKIWAFLIVLPFIFIALLTFFLILERKTPETYSKASYNEVNELAGRNLSFKELSDYFSDLAKNKGAKYAYEVLKIAPTQPNIDMHLLGHIVGDELYKQEGANGIKICTDDFRNACSHAIVVGLFSDKGEEALSEITEACKQAPGGSGAYSMCFHGLGHGILAFYGYDMVRASETCQKIKKDTTRQNSAEMPQCVSGTVMEIIGGGFHDRELWAEKRKDYLRVSDPLSPCSQDFVPASARYLCYVYLTPNLFQLAGGDIGHLKAQDFEKSFPYCGLIPESEPANKDACYGGFGKEFVVLAKARDIRNVENMSESELKTVYDWCLLAKNKKGINSCIVSATNSLYWGGENDRQVSIRFCGLIGEGDSKAICFNNLINNVSIYAKDPLYRKDFCSEIPDDYLNQCQSRLLSNQGLRINEK